MMHINQVKLNTQIMNFQRLRCNLCDIKILVYLVFI